MSLTSSKKFLFPLLLPLLFLGSSGISVATEEVDPPALPVCESMPEGAEVLGKVAASSRRTSIRTSNGKRSYVIREMQRQGRKFSAEALVLNPIKEISEHKPQYGQRPGSMRYTEVVHLYGSGSAIRLQAGAESLAENGCQLSE